jgi:hypothetical protein
MLTPPTPAAPGERVDPVPQRGPPRAPTSWPPGAARRGARDASQPAAGSPARCVSMAGASARDPPPRAPVPQVPSRTGFLGAPFGVGPGEPRSLAATTPAPDLLGLISPVTLDPGPRLGLGHRRELLHLALGGLPRPKLLRCNGPGSCFRPTTVHLTPPRHAESPPSLFVIEHPPEGRPLPGPLIPTARLRADPTHWRRTLIVDADRVNASTRRSGESVGLVGPRGMSTHRRGFERVTSSPGVRCCSFVH